MSKLVVPDTYRKYFYKKELVKIVYLLDELNKDRVYKKYIKTLG